MKILLVDDESALTEPLSRLLTREGYTVDVAINGRVGSSLASGGNYNLLILDWMLPDLTGLEICQHLRSQGDLTPVLFLTAKDTLDDLTIGLDAGADCRPAIYPAAVGLVLAGVTAQGQGPGRPGLRIPA